MERLASQFNCNLDLILLMFCFILLFLRFVFYLWFCTCFIIPVQFVVLFRSIIIGVYLVMSFF